MSERDVDLLALVVTFDDGNVLVVPCKNPPFLITTDSVAWAQYMQHRNRIVQLHIPTRLATEEGVPMILPDPDARLHQ